MAHKKAGGSSRNGRDDPVKVPIVRRPIREGSPDRGTPEQLPRCHECLAAGIEPLHERVTFGRAAIGEREADNV